MKYSFGNVAILRFFAFAIFCLTLHCESTFAKPRKMTAVDLLNIPSLSNGQVAGSNNELIYAKSESNWKRNKAIKHYWIQNSNTDKARQLTFGDSSESKGKLSNDRQLFTFVRKKNSSKKYILYGLSLLGGEAEPLIELPGKLYDYAWGKNDDSLILLMRKPKTKEQQKTSKGQTLISEFSTKKKPSSLWHFDLKNRKLSPLIQDDFSIRRFSLSSDKSRLVYVRSPSAYLDDSINSDIWIYDLTTKEHQSLTKNVGSYNKIEISPNGKEMLYISWTNEKGEAYYQDNLFTLSLSTREPTLHLADFDHQILQAHYSKDGSQIFFRANLGVHSELFRYDLKNKKITPLTNGKHHLRDWQYDALKDEHLIQIQSSTNKGDYWKLKSGDNQFQLVQQTHLFDELQETYLLPEQKAIQWPGEDGTTIEGLLTLPLNYKKSRKYPLIVQTHGGPRDSDKFGVFHPGRYLPVMAAQGYMILQPNYRGSTGYGDDFLRDMVGSYFNQAHKDVMTGIDFLVKKGMVDNNQLGKMGWSAGGHMTNKLVTYTNRFKAASSGAGASNWVSMYAQTDTRSKRAWWFGGSPWMKDAPIDVYWENSPIKDVHKVRTPTLLLVGDRDVRVPKQQSIEFYRGLKENGVETQLYVAPREPHAWKELKHRLFKINTELEWFEKHIRGKKYRKQKAPG